MVVIEDRPTATKLTKQLTKAIETLQGYEETQRQIVKTNMDIANSVSGLPDEAKAYRERAKEIIQRVLLMEEGINNIKAVLTALTKEFEI